MADIEIIFAASFAGSYICKTKTYVRYWIEFCRLFSASNHIPEDGRVSGPVTTASMCL